MTVRELIDKLDLLITADATLLEVEVVTEGCDCYGDAQDLKIEETEDKMHSKYVLITRQ